MKWAQARDSLPLHQAGERADLFTSPNTIKRKFSAPKSVGSAGVVQGSGIRGRETAGSGKRLVGVCVFVRAICVWRQLFFGARRALCARMRARTCAHAPCARQRGCPLAKEHVRARLYPGFCVSVSFFFLLLARNVDICRLEGRSHPATEEDIVCRRSATQSEAEKFDSY